MRRWNTASFSDCDRCTCKQQLRVSAGGPAERYRGTPDPCRDRDDPNSIAAIGPARDGNSQHGIEECECNPAQESELRIAESQLGLDILEQQSQREPIDIVERQDEQQDDDE